MEDRVYPKEEMITEIATQLHDKILLGRISADFIGELARDLEISFTASESIVLDYSHLINFVGRVFRNNKFGELLLKLNENNILSNGNGNVSTAYMKFLKELSSHISKGYWPSELGEVVEIKKSINYILSGRSLSSNNTVFEEAQKKPFSELLQKIWACKSIQDPKRLRELINRSELGAQIDASGVYQQLYQLVEAAINFEKINIIVDILKEPGYEADNVGNFTNDLKNLIRYMGEVAEIPSKINGTLPPSSRNNIMFVLLKKENKGKLYRAVFSSFNSIKPRWFFLPLDVDGVKKSLNKYIADNYKTLPFRIDFILEDEDIYELEIDQWEYQETYLLGSVTHTIVRSLNLILYRRHSEDEDTMRNHFLSFHKEGGKKPLILVKDDDMLHHVGANINSLKDVNAVFACLEQTSENQTKFRDTIWHTMNKQHIPIILFLRKCNHTLKLTEFIEAVRLSCSQDESILKFVRNQRENVNNTNPVGSKIVIVYDDPDDRDKIVDVSAYIRSSIFRNYVNSFNANNFNNRWRLS
ncbi:MAG: hypothetical protein HOP27_00195 [Anaerolineales bacterium]|nr:hypothetical protein [Anaerolineales bacterium]